LRDHTPIGCKPRHV